jgi:hypothetical protein
MACEDKEVRLELQQIVTKASSAVGQLSLKKDNRNEETKTVPAVSQILSKGDVDHDKSTRRPNVQNIKFCRKNCSIRGILLQ